MSQYQDKNVADLMKKEDYPRNERLFCHIGFNDACINFKIQFDNYDFDILEKCIADVSEYNEYKGAKVAKAFASIKHLLYRASFGREGSPVLYLHVNIFEKTAAQAKASLKAVSEAFKDCAVDENGLWDEGNADNSKSCLRLWWD